MADEKPEMLALEEILCIMVLGVGKGGDRREKNMENVVGGKNNYSVQMAKEISV